MTIEKLEEKILTIFKLYPQWISIIFFFLPGILYQANIIGKDISQYDGLSIILFLAISFYYSLPFIFIGTFMYFLSEKKELDKNSSFSIGLYAVTIYFITSILYVYGIGLGRLIFGFWDIFIIGSITLIFILTILSFLESKRKSNQRINKLEKKLK